MSVKAIYVDPLESLLEECKQFPDVLRLAELADFARDPQHWLILATAGNTGTLVYTHGMKPGVGEDAADAGLIAVGVAVVIPVEHYKDLIRRAAANEPTNPEIAPDVQA